MSELIPAESELPSALTTRDQWLCWRAEERDGKLTKVPIDPTARSFASTTDPATWSDFETAVEQVRSGSVDGLGFVFTDDDPIVGVDLDDCRIPETGKTREWATDIIDRLDSYTEVSPSGTGYHILVEGSLPDGRNRKDDLEMYETARFFTVTADHVKDTPSTVELRDDELESVHREYLCEDDESDAPNGTRDQTASVGGHTASGSTPDSSLSDQALIERATTAANGEKFARLWRGSTAGYDSHSEADMALCSLLAFWTGGDASQVDRLFRDSGLIREKWDERHFADGSTYGEKTIERAIAGTDEFYEPPTEEQNDTARIKERNVSTAMDTTSSVRDFDQSQTRERQSARIERLEKLEAELREALSETEQLRRELEAERARRHELEAELEQNSTETTQTKWWLRWIGRFR